MIRPAAGLLSLNVLFGSERKFTPGSMYRDNFIYFNAKPLSVRPSFKPPPPDFMSAGKFEGTSMQRTDFPAFEGARPSSPFIPAPEIFQSDKEDRKFESESRGTYSVKGYVK